MVQESGLYGSEYSPSFFHECRGLILFVRNVAFFSLIYDKVPAVLVTFG